MKDKTKINKKVKITLSMLLLIFFSIFSSSCAQKPSIDPREIILKAIETYGGEEASREKEDKNNFYLRVNYSSLDGDQYIYTLYIKKPDKLRTESYAISEDILSTSIYNAGKVYMAKNDERIVDADQISRFRKSANLNLERGLFSILYLLDHQDKINYVGEKLIRGKKYHGFEILRDHEIEQTYFLAFDTKSFLVVTTPATRFDGVYYSDFQEINNIAYPFHRQLYSGEEKMAEGRVEEISFDELDDSLFEIKEDG